jgi:DNA helicase HerA-like ATPase
VGADPVAFDAAVLDKVNALVGNKGSGKSHTAKVLLHQLTGFGAPAFVFDVNREFTELPGANSLRVGDNYRLRLDEVGFSFLMALIDDMNPMTDVSRGAFEHAGPRFVAEEIQATGFATIEYLLERAEQGRYHNNDMVNNAIYARLRMVSRSGLFEVNPSAPTLAERFDAAVDAGGFLVIDLAEFPAGRRRALTRGFLRRLEAICEEERRSGRDRYPFVFFEEAHMYTAPEEIMNLITRGRHLGLTTFFMTNSPGELPEVIFRQLDNLIVTGLSHSSDLRLIGRSALSDEETPASLAVGLRRTEALIVGRLTNSFPLVVNVDDLPAGYPATGATRTFWAREAEVEEAA